MSTDFTRGMRTAYIHVYTDLASIYSAQNIGKKTNSSVTRKKTTMFLVCMQRVFFCFFFVAYIFIFALCVYVKENSWFFDNGRWQTIYTVLLCQTWAIELKSVMCHREFTSVCLCCCMVLLEVQLAIYSSFALEIKDIEAWPPLTDLREHLKVQKNAVKFNMTCTAR